GIEFVNPHSIMTGAHGAGESDQSIRVFPAFTIFTIFTAVTALSLASSGEFCDCGNPAARSARIFPAWANRLTRKYPNGRCAGWLRTAVHLRAPVVPGSRESARHDRAGHPARLSCVWNSKS